MLTYCSSIVFSFTASILGYLNGFIMHVNNFIPIDLQLAFGANSIVSTIYSTIFKEAFDPSTKSVTYKYINNLIYIEF